MNLQANADARALDHGDVSLAEPLSPGVARSPRLSLKQTRARIRGDYRRLATLLGSRPDVAKMLWAHPSFLCVLLYRIEHHLWRSGHMLGARAIWQLNFMLTGADISPAADIGEGLVILSPAGTALMGAAGRNLTIMPCAGFGGEMGSFDDIGAGPGLPLLQDDIVMEPHSGILGPIRVGNRVRVRAGVVLIKDAPDDSDVTGPEPRFMGRRSAQ